MKKNYGTEFAAYAAQVPRFGSPAAFAGFILSQLELKVPPLVIIVLSAGAMYLCAQTHMHGFELAVSIRTALAVSAAIVAMIILATALLTFRKHQTTMNPLNPSQTNNIVSSGIYGYTRNPMYVSMFIVNRPGFTGDFKS